MTSDLTTRVATPSPPVDSSHLQRDPLRLRLPAPRSDAQAVDRLVAMKPVAEGMGLAWNGQFERINRNPVLAQGIREIVIPSAGGHQAMTALPLSKLNFWLATIQPNKAPHLRGKASRKS